MLNFNSIKVRLEHAANAGANVVRAFQFHKGTIRTLKIHLTFSWIKKISIP